MPAGLRLPGRRALLAWASLGLLLLLPPAGAEPPSRPAVPAHNDPRLTSPPPVPPAGTAAARAKLLVEAIRRGKPELATPLFFPPGAFRRVKAIKDPERYFRQILRLYHEDVLELRRGLAHPNQLELVGFKLSRRVR